MEKILHYFFALILLACPATLTVLGVQPETDVIHQLEPYAVVVTRTSVSKELLPVSISSIGPRDLERLGVSDAADLIRYEPLVSLPFDVGGSDPYVPYASPGYSAYSIRGIGGNRILLQIDGIRQPMQMGATQGGTRTDFFDPTLFSSLEILKGSASSLYGSDAIGGVIALQTRAFTPQPTDFIEFKARADTFNNGISILALGSKQFNQSSVIAAHAQRWEQERKNYGRTPANPEDMHSRHSLVNLRHNPASQHAFSLTAETFSRKHDADFDSAEGPDSMTGLNVLEVTYNTRQQRDRISLNYDWTAPDTSILQTIRAQLHWQDAQTLNDSRQIAETLGSPGNIERDRQDIIGFEQTQRGGEILSELRFDHSHWQHRATIGVSGDTTFAASSFVRYEYVFTGDIENRIGMAPSDTTRLALFLQDEVTIGKWLWIAGIRIESYDLNPDNTEAYFARLNERLPPDSPPMTASDFSLNSIAPSIAFSYELHPNIRAYARYAKGFRQPTAEEYTGIFVHGSDFIQIPNPNLKEESSNSFELGLKAFYPRFDAQAALFYSRVNDFFETVETRERFDPDDPLSLEIQQIRNVSKAEIYGYEFSGQYFLTDPRQPGAHWSLIASAGQAFGEDRTSGDPLRSIDPFKAIAALRWERADDAFSIDLSATYIAKHHAPPKPIEIDPGVYSSVFVPDASLVFNVTGYYRINRNLQIQFGIRNITDEEYHLWSNANLGIHFADNPDRTSLPGRNAYLGITLRF